MYKHPWIQAAACVCGQGSSVNAVRTDNITTYTYYKIEYTVRLQTRSPCRKSRVLDIDARLERNRTSHFATTTDQ